VLAKITFLNQIQQFILTNQRTVEMILMKLNYTSKLIKNNINLISNLLMK